MSGRAFVCGSPTADEDAEREKKGRDEQHSQQEHSRPAFVALKLFKRRMARARSLCVGLVAHERQMKTVSNSRLTCRRNFQQMPARADHAHTPARNFVACTRART